MEAVEDIILSRRVADDTTSPALLLSSFSLISWFPSFDGPQSVAMRLVLWRRMDRPAAEWEPLARRIKERQNVDGGWSQAPEMASDAWATGQAVSALAHAGLRSDESVIRRAQAFPINTQRPDGSWPMTSRPMKPGGEGCKRLIPITGAGTAWALLGLVRPH